MQITSQDPARSAPVRESKAVTLLVNFPIRPLTFSRAMFSNDAMRSYVHQRPMRGLPISRIAAPTTHKYFDGITRVLAFAAVDACTSNLLRPVQDDTPFNEPSRTHGFSNRMRRKSLAFDKRGHGISKVRTSLEHLYSSLSVP